MTLNLDDELADWATKEAQRLRSLESNARAHGGRLRAPAITMRGQASAALEFLRRYASDTQFLAAAEACFDRSSPADAAHALQRVAEILELWKAFIKDGMAQALPFPVQARIEAATDLMEQVQQLISDAKVHPAAPVVLAGAALEEFLRSKVAETGVTVTGKPGISSYSSALRSSGHLSAQDVKDITAWAGQRNEAAHGEFGKLSPQRAQLMVDGINLFMRQKTPNTQTP
ncbi:hypothetical protein [Actinomadura sp. HBU206391]|uniref:hypothetical protein n=1 Tax=Actinomadura sp. HBU206391 TaxID=2731692 RepID=UPI001650D14A|nr:hypothetical protein [Actinomadura sp. HBU206391]MBC6456364.1 hypothetical protein [Actinomadura sp. HBU206391]